MFETVVKLFCLVLAAIHIFIYWSKYNHIFKSYSPKLFLLLSYKLLCFDHVFVCDSKSTSLFAFKIICFCCYYSLSSSLFCGHGRVDIVYHSIGGQRTDCQVGSFYRYMCSRDWSQTCDVLLPTEPSLRPPFLYSSWAFLQKNRENINI